MSQYLSCIIVDDELAGIRLVEAFLEKIPNVEPITSFQDAVAARAFLETNHTDILITDIQMPQLSGLDMIRSLSFVPEVIFTTAHRNFAADGFDVDAVDFLLKPLNFARFQTAIDKARLRLQSRWIVSRQKTDFLFIKHEHKHIRVPLRDIAYMEAMGDYIHIFLQDHSRLTTRRTLADLQVTLPADQFIRVHKSYIINVAMIRSVQPSLITLNSDEEIPVAKSYRAAVCRKLGIG